MLGIVIPVWIQNRTMLDLTYECLRSLRYAGTAAVYLVCNRLHTVTPGEFQAESSRCCELPVMVLHESGVERSVAGAWNHGIREAQRDGANLYAVVGNDTKLHPDCLDILAGYGGADVWSGASQAVAQTEGDADGCDFSCAMLRQETVERFGWFDEEYRPAYFEDNDYYTAVVLGGGHCRVVCSARFEHAGSATIRNDPEAAHHVKHWWEINRARYVRKWGADPVPVNEADVWARCSRRAFHAR